MATISDLIYRFGADMSMVDKAFDTVETRSRGVNGILKSALSTATGFIGAQVAMEGVGKAFGFIKNAAFGIYFVDVHF